MATGTPSYRLTPAAERDLEGIWLYTREQWGPAKADEYVDQLAEACALFAAHPDRAPDCSHIRAGYRRFLVGSHVVYCRRRSQGIDVIRILHQRMDAPRHL